MNAVARHRAGARLARAEAQRHRRRRRPAPARLAAPKRSVTDGGASARPLASPRRSAASLAAAAHPRARSPRRAGSAASPTAAAPTRPPAANQTRRLTRRPPPAVEPARLRTQPGRPPDFESHCGPTRAAAAVPAAAHGAPRSPRGTQPDGGPSPKALRISSFPAAHASVGPPPAAGHSLLDRGSVLASGATGHRPPTVCTWLSLLPAKEVRLPKCSGTRLGGPLRISRNGASPSWLRSTRARPTASGGTHRIARIASNCAAPPLQPPQRTCRNCGTAPNCAATPPARAAAAVLRHRSHRSHPATAATAANRLAQPDAPRCAIVLVSQPHAARRPAERAVQHVDAPVARSQPAVLPVRVRAAAHAAARPRPPPFLPVVRHSTVNTPARSAPPHPRPPALPHQPRCLGHRWSTTPAGLALPHSSGAARPAASTFWFSRVVEVE